MHFAHFDLEMCFALEHRNVQSAPNVERGVLCKFWPRNVLLCATTACNNFSSLIWPDGSAPAALASLLFELPDPQRIGKTLCFATCYLFARFELLSADSFSSDLFSSLTLPTSAFPSVYIVGSLTLNFYRPIPLAAPGPLFRTGRGPSALSMAKLEKKWLQRARAPFFQYWSRAHVQSSANSEVYEAPRKTQTDAFCLIVYIFWFFFMLDLTFLKGRTSLQKTGVFEWFVIICHVEKFQAHNGTFHLIFSEVSRSGSFRQCWHIKICGFFSRAWRHKKSRPAVLRTFELNRAQSHSARFLWLLFDRFWFDFFILDVVNAMLCGREARWRLTPQEPVQCCLPPVCAHGWLWYRGWGVEDVPEQGDASEMQLWSSCRFTRIVFVKLFSSSVNHVSNSCSTITFSAHGHRLNPQHPQLQPGLGLQQSLMQSLFRCGGTFRKVHRRWQDQNGSNFNAWNA